MTILHFKVVLAAIFIKININNRKTRPYGQFYSLVTSKYVPLIVFNRREVIIRNLLQVMSNSHVFYHRPTIYF